MGLRGSGSGKKREGVIEKGKERVMERNREGERKKKRDLII
jgi:hypothetical protein